jgi:hypothetical protein
MLDSGVAIDGWTIAIDESCLYDKRNEGGDLQLYDVIWKDQFVEKLATKHGITTEEAEEVLFSEPHIRLAEKGRVKDEPLYAAYGQPQQAGI